MAAMATMTGHCLAFTTHEGDSNQSEKHCKTHNNSSIHL